MLSVDKCQHFLKEINQTLMTSERVKEIDREIGRRMKLIRDKLGFNKVHYAKKLGVDRTLVYHYERGTRRPSLKICVKIISLAEVSGYKVTMDYLRPDLFPASSEESP
jgi:DNA-binding XRE family transcriptional regulator